MELLSRIVMTVDTHTEAADLERHLMPIIHATRGDSLEVCTVNKPMGDGSLEVTIYIIIHTMNYLGMAHDLRLKMNEPIGRAVSDNEYEGGIRMAQLRVQVAYQPDQDTYKIVAHLTDAADSRSCGETVYFRDMGQVRSYYNGWTSAMGKAVGYGNLATLDMIGWPYSQRQFEIPANMQYLIDVDLPDDLRGPHE